MGVMGQAQFAGIGGTNYQTRQKPHVRHSKPALANWIEEGVNTNQHSILDPIHFFFFLLHERKNGYDMV